MKWVDVEALIDSLNYFYSYGIEGGASWDFDVNMGVFKYPSIDSTPDLIDEGEANLYLEVPHLNIFNDYDDAEEAFDDVFGLDETHAHIDQMGEAKGYGEYYNETAAEWVELHSYVQFGYQLPSEADNNTYIGINFEVECPEAYYLEGATIINWAKYTLLDLDFNEVAGESYAVACIIHVGDVNATEVKFYENTAEIETMDDVELENLEIDSPWEITDYEYYYPEWIYNDDDGSWSVKQPCLIMQEWSYPEARRNLQYENDYYNYEDYDYTTGTEGTTDATTYDDSYYYESTEREAYGTYKIISGARYIYQNETTNEEIVFNFYNQTWDVEYRPPEEAPEYNVQVQGQIENEQTISIDQTDGTTVNGIAKQSLFLGYEIVEDLETDNVLGMHLTLDIPGDLVPDGSIIVQSVSFRKEFEYADPWLTVTCKTTVGTASDSDPAPVVTNFGSYDII